MTIKISRIDSNNFESFTSVDPEIFDGKIDLEKVVDFIASENHLMVFASEDGLVLGQIRAMLHLQPDGPKQLYIDNLGVAPNHLRQGIASLLLQEVLLWGKANGCGDAWVATELDNDAARGLYSTFISEPEQTMAYFQIAIQ